MWKTHHECHFPNGKPFWFSMVFSTSFCMVGPYQVASLMVYGCLWGMKLQFSWIYKAKKHLAGASLCINIMYYIGNLNVGLRIHYDIIIYYSCLYGYPLCPPAPNTFSDCIWSCFLGSKHLLREYLDVFGALGMYHLVIIFHYYIIIVYVIAMNP